MSNIRSTDLIIVGRGNASFKLPFSDVKEAVLGTIVLPDGANPDFQVGTLDDRYLHISGGSLTGYLSLHADPTQDAHAANKAYVDAAIEAATNNIDILPDINNPNQQVGTIDGRYVNVLGDSMSGDLILGKDATPTDPKAAVRKSYVDSADQLNAGAISALDAEVSAEISRAKAAEAALEASINAEVNRATDAENALDTKIDGLKLDDLADVSVAGATAGQVVSFDSDSGEFVARTIALSSNLDYQGQCDLTQGAIAGEAGQLLVNIGSGSTDASWGSAVTSPVPTAVGGELVAYNGSAWQYVGTVGGGLTYTSFKADNLAATPDSEGQLTYNSDNGTFSFTKVDLASRIPFDITRLSALPA